LMTEVPTSTQIVAIEHVDQLLHSAADAIYAIQLP
jgi:hypothetical protein